MTSKGKAKKARVNASHDPVSLTTPGNKVRRPEAKPAPVSIALQPTASPGLAGSAGLAAQALVQGVTDMIPGPGTRPHVLQLKPGTSQPNK